MGNPDFMNIKYDTLDEFAGELQAITQAGRAVIDGLTQSLQSNTQLWVGVASAGYEADHQKWNKQFDWMEQVLNTIQNHTNETNSLYQQVEARNTAMWGGQ